MGAISDIVNIGDWSRMRMWVMAIGVAMIGTGALAWAGRDRPDQDDLYLGQAGLAVGGGGRADVRFLGMVLASGAAARRWCASARAISEVAGGLHVPGALRLYEGAARPVWAWCA